MFEAFHWSCHDYFHAQVLGGSQAWARLMGMDKAAIGILITGRHHQHPPYNIVTITVTLTSPPPLLLQFLIILASPTVTSHPHPCSHLPGSRPPPPPPFLPSSQKIHSWFTRWETGMRGLHGG